MDARRAGRQETSAARKYSVPVRIYYEDTDVGGIVYHANHLRFMERARTDFLRHLGFAHQRLADEFKMQFVVTDIALKYLKPARLDDLLQVTVCIAALGRARVVFAQTIEHEGSVLASGAVTVACLDLAGLRPTPIPSPLHEKLKDMS
jgi:tol-pal system-associated acyl-CoA thioesterase